MLAKLSAMIEAVNTLEGQLEQILIDDENRQQVQDLITKMQDFRTVLTADFVQAMDIFIGFNSNDGD